MLDGGVDVVGGGKLGDDRARLRLGKRAQPPIDLVVRGVLLGGVDRRKWRVSPLHGEGDLRCRAQNLLERQPPEVAATVGEVARHVDRERRAVAAEDRVGVIAIVAIAVIEREAGEGLLSVGVLEARAHLIERDDVETGIEHFADDVLEEARA